MGGKGAACHLPRRGGGSEAGLCAVEELETFARFGARLDAETRRIIEHGRRIRACLKQAESAPVPVPAQIAVLLALTSGLFDPVPLEQMTAAQQAVQSASADLPAEIVERFESDHKLSDEERAAILETVRHTLRPLVAEVKNAHAEKPRAAGGA